MESLNYHHLLYFWTVARLGSVVRASEELRLAQPTISGQIRRLEEVLGVKLFERVGRRLVLSETGRTTFSYANEIFSIGNELVGTLQGQQSLKPLRLTVGVADVLCKVMVQRLIRPAFLIDRPIELICRENRAVEEFLHEMPGELDLVLADRPLGPSRVQAYNHALGGCGTTFLASAELAKTYRRGFPASLESAPFLLPGDHATVRRALDDWFYSQKIRQTVVAEFDDSALMYAFGEEGRGIFPAPTIFEKEFRKRYNVQVVGSVEEIRQNFYAISVKRRTQHPAVEAIIHSARDQIFKAC